MMGDDWQTVGSTPSAETSVLTWLESKGLGKHAEKIIEVTDAESVDDFKLLDAAMLEDVIKSAELKLVSAQKFRLAVSELSADGAQADGTFSTDGAQADGHMPTLSSELPIKASSECVAICIDRSGSMGSPIAEVTLNVVRGETKNSVSERTRMEAVKAMFYAFRDRVESLGQGHELGLIQFDNQIEELLDLTPRLDQFERIVDDMQKRGQTAIYSAVAQAAEMLEQRFQADSTIDLRILVLTDGQNNTGMSPEAALEAVNRIEAVVDAIIVGDTPDADLRRIVSATGGECYQINSLGEGFELLEAEGVVSLRARRGGEEKPPFQQRPPVNFSSLAEKSITKVSAVQRAPLLSQTFASKTVVDVTSMGGASGKSASLGAPSLKRVLLELKQVAERSAAIWLHSGEGIHIFPAQDSINFWRVLIEGPPDSPFEGGIFALNVLIPDNYPFRPPQITFETPIYHCNVSDSGKVCLDMLQDKWAPSLSVPKCLEAILFLMKNPDTDNSLRQWIAELTLAHQNSNGADTRYYEKATESTRKDASFSVADWKQKWGC